MTAVTTKSRTVHFFDLKAIAYDPANPRIQHTANIEPLWRNLARLVPIKGHANTSFHAFYGQEMAVAIDVNDSEKVMGRSAKVRRDALPGIIRSGRYDRIRLGNDEYLYETSHFVYFKRTQIMAIEYSQHAPGYRFLEKYLGDFAHAMSIAVDQITLEIKLGQNTLNRLMNSGAVTAVEVTVSAEDVATLPPRNKLSQALRGVVQGRADRYKATVIWQRERPTKRGPRGLEDEFKSEAIALLETSKVLLDALKVTVEPAGGGKPRTIDLLKDRFVATLDLNLTPERSIDTDDTYSKIVSHYNDYGLGVIE